MSNEALPLFLRKSSLEIADTWLEAARETGAAVLVDKESGWTSFDVVAKLRSLTKIKKIGHAGTLDPLATGLLIVCLGKATKQIEQFQGQSKRYEAVIKLGATTRTDDAEAPEENITETEAITAESITAATEQFIGEIEQIPPIFSAIKVDGQPLYKSARKGKTVEPRPRLVQIYGIAVRNITLPYIQLDVHCGKGTYIRSLARDIGALLGCGGYLHSLRRTAIGDYNVSDAVMISDVREHIGKLTTAG